MSQTRVSACSRFINKVKAARTLPMCCAVHCVARACTHAGYINAVIQAVKRSRGADWEAIRTKFDPAVKEKKGWLVPKL